MGLLFVEAVTVIMKLAFSSHAEKVEFFRGFKRGKFALIFITAIPLYYIGHVYSGNGYVEAFFTSINKIVHLVVLKYDTASIHSLLEASRIYSVAVYACFALVAFNALFFAISLTGQYLWEYWQKVKMLVVPREKLIIYGLNEGSRKLYASDKRGRCKLIVDNISKDDAYDLYLEKISYTSTVAPETLMEKFIKGELVTNKKLIIVVNTESEERNMLCCKSFAGLLRGLPEASREKLIPRVQIYVIGDPEYSSIYEDIISSGYGCLRYVNKYSEVAADWIDKYPLSKFATEAHVDYSTALVRDGVDINVCLVGFGRVNREVFLTSVANNQFIKRSETSEDPDIKTVKYHIFDKKHAENDKNLNHSYYRFKHECGNLDKESYLDLPQIPAEEYFYRTDINDFEFYEQLREICIKNTRDLNFLVISYGSDLENIDLAQKLIEKRREWGLTNLYIFVRASNFKQEDTLVEDEGAYFFGYESETVYDVESIISDKLFKMAMLRNEAYDAEHDGAVGELAEKIISEARKQSESSWYNGKNQTQRDSSVFCCLSIRSKLNLIGLDYVLKDSEGDALSYSEYMDIYAADDMPQVQGASLSGRPRIKYSLDFPRSLRRNLAVAEHLRWNSFMISRGFVPSTREQIKTELVVDERTGKCKNTNGKNFTARRHGNLTTFDGLVEFREITAERDGLCAADTDVIKYDYQLLDEVYWLLDATGHKIVRLAQDVKKRFAHRGKG